jgi:hypothetical protein
MAKKIASEHGAIHNRIWTWKVHESILKSCKNGSEEREVEGGTIRY